jgi:phosphoglycolate phosphatase
MQAGYFYGTRLRKKRKSDAASGQKKQVPTEPKAQQKHCCKPQKRICFSQQGGNMRAFLFDLDGTLVDTLEDIAAACNGMLHQLGFAQHPVAAYRHFVGNGFTVMIQKALPAGIAAQSSTEQIERYVALARSLYAACYLQQSCPYPQVHESLRELARRGALLGVLSNKPQPQTAGLVAALFPDIPFFAVRGAVAGVPLKPDPTAALDLLQQAGIAPQHCAFVGDSAVDIHTALAAGLCPVGVSWGFRGLQEVLDAGAQHCVHCASQWLDLYTEAK